MICFGFELSGCSYPTFSEWVKNHVVSSSNGMISSSYLLSLLLSGTPFSRFSTALLHSGPTWLSVSALSPVPGFRSMDTNEVTQTSTDTVTVGSGVVALTV